MPKFMHLKRKNKEEVANKSIDTRYFQMSNFSGQVTF
jgi:hypothetical protein